MFQYLKEILHILSDDRRKLPALILLFLGMSLLDVVGLSLIGPYLAVIVKPQILEGQLMEVIKTLGLPQEQQPLLIFLGLALICIFLFKSILGIYINYKIIHFSWSQQERLCSLMMQVYQSQSYSKYLRRNSSEYIHTILQLTGTFAGTILILLRLVSDGIVVLVILALLAWTNLPALALLVGILLPVVISYDRFFRPHLVTYGQEMNEAWVSMAKGIQEGFDGFKEIRVLGNESFFYQKVREGVKRYTYFLTRQQIISAAPRYLLELMMISFIVLLVVGMLLLDQGFEAFLPTLGIFGVAVIRIFPSVNTATTSLSQIRFGSDSLSRLYREMTDVEHLNIKTPSGRGNAPGGSFQTLLFKRIRFRYPNVHVDALDRISMEIRAEDSIGLIGPSGAGKTTLVDVLLGLLVPQEGEILYNGQPLIECVAGWRSQVAYLPQQVFLIDNTLRRNVALGVKDEEINEDRIHEALRQARLTELVEQLPHGVETLIGERGVRLSGGQRQRVTLARAFYHRRNVLIMDEATSSLDNETEQEIVDEIRHLKGKKTLIVIAHRLSTVKHCNRIYRLENGRIVNQGTYEKVIQR